MRTSIATVCLSGTLTDKLHGRRRAGFDGVEIFEPDLVASPASPEEIAALAARLGLTLDLYQPFRDAEGVTEAEFERRPAPGAREVRAHATARHRHDARVQQRRHRHGRRRRGLGVAAAPAGRGGRGARRPDRLRGAGLGAVRRRLPPRLADRRARGPSTPSAPASTASTSSPAATTPPRSRRSRGRRSSSSSSRTRRC